MKPNWKQIQPHLLAIGIFLVVSIVYCLPAIQGMVLEQHDIIQWMGMAKDAETFRIANGHYPNWTQGIFSGMPSFQIAFYSNNVVPWLIPRIMGLFLPIPILYFFLSCIAFYILAVTMRFRTVVAIFGALAFAFATYNPVIIVEGHHTKMLSIAMMPAMLAGVMLVLHKKYWLGTALTAVFTGALIAMGHLQIAYYFMLIVALMLVSYTIKYLKEKQLKHLIISALLIGTGAGIGVLSNAVNLISTYDYAKETIRGGSALAQFDTTSQGKQLNTVGLDSAYAMSYSFGITEPIVMIVPRMMGGSSIDPLPEDGALAEVFAQYPGLGQQFPASAYWGGIGSTKGPPYAGAIVCILAIFAFFVIDRKYKWWLLAATALSIMLAWGGYFYSFNGFLLEHLPMYNKFRAPSMAIIMCQLTLPFTAALGLQKLMEWYDAKQINMVKIKQGAIAAGVLLAICIGFYFMASYQSGYEQEMLKQVNGIEDAQTKSVYLAAFDALKVDRQTLAGADLARSLFFILAAAFLILAFVKNKLKPTIAVAIIAGLSFIDLVGVDSRYMNKESYIDVAKDDNGEPIFPELEPTTVNLQIQQDKGVYRVFDARQSKVVNGVRKGVDPFSDASQAYHHHIINGYHAAKLSIYQDLIEQQLRTGNQQVINMLNTKYIIINGSTGADSAIINPMVNGPAWFAQQLLPAANAWQEMRALDTINTRTTAVVPTAQMANIPAIQMDSAATITIAEYGNEKLVYNINTSTPQFAVLSEIYYNRGWIAHVDGKETPIIKTNYVLRGVAIPAGAKKLELTFDSSAFNTGFMLTNIFQWLSIILLVVALFMVYKQSKKPKVA